MAEIKKVVFPEDLTSLTTEQLTALETAGIAYFESLASAERPNVPELAALADDIERVQGVRKSMAAESATFAATQARFAAMKTFATQSEQADKDAVALKDASKDPAAQAGVENAIDNAHVDKAEEAQDDSLTAGARKVGGATTTPRERGTRGLNPSLSEIQARQADQGIGSRRRESVLVASADIPGIGMGSNLENMDALVAAMQQRAGSLPVTARGDNATRYPVASLKREFRNTLGPDARPDEISDILRAATDVDSLVAAGGWCSPSEISYDFYNIVASDGQLDLPTIGINRGGLRWPVSPSFGDLVGNAAMWSWNETQDIAAVTGTAQSGTKTCARVPCPTFNEARLACDGLCLTVGNLTEDAFPELIANHTRLLFAAHAHKMNAKRISQLVAASVSVTGDGNVTGAGVVAPVIGALSLQAIDYRDKYAMADGAILEVVLPRWIRSMMRADMRKRTGVDLLSVSDARVMQMFDAENLRVQWVNDWQVRSAGFPGNSSAILAWPTQVRALMFAPGTFVLGQGLRLDLGVVRDSVLNATNDHTAEWMEECWLIAQQGHESRNILMNVCADGTTGAADLTACGV